MTVLTQEKIKCIALIRPLLGLLFLSGCSSLDIRTDYDTGYAFSTLKTYAWLDGKPPSGDIRINNGLIIKRVVNAVNAELQAKGYVLVDKSQADFHVNWFGGIENKLRQDTVETYYADEGYAGSSWAGGYRPYSRTYISEFQQGTLIIDIADSRSKQLIWRGTGTRYLRNNETPDEITARINEIVGAILKSFPPGVASTDKPQ